MSSYHRFGSSYNPNGDDKKPYESADQFEERCREDAAEHDIKAAERRNSRESNAREFPEDC